MKARLGAAGLALLLLIAGPAAAQPAGDDARDHDARARALFQEGKLEEAARAFEEAFAIAPHPATRYNAAYAWDKLGDAPRAADGYAAALEMPQRLDDARAAAAAERLSALSRELGIVRVTGPVGRTIRLAHVTGALVPARVYVAPGKHVVTLVGDPDVAREIVVRAGESVVVRFDPLPAPAPREPEATPRASVRPDAPEDGSNAALVAGITLLAVGAAGGAATAALGVATIDARDTFVAGGNLDEEARDEAVTLRAATNVVLGMSVACAVAGGVTLVVDLTRDDGARGARLRLGPGFVGVAATY